MTYSVYNIMVTFYPLKIFSCYLGSQPEDMWTHPRWARISKAGSATLSLEVWCAPYGLWLNVHEAWARAITPILTRWRLEPQWKVRNGSATLSLEIWCSFNGLGWNLHEVWARAISLRWTHWRLEPHWKVGNGSATLSLEPLSDDLSFAKICVKLEPEP